jgi:hypothetical protein
MRRGLIVSCVCWLVEEGEIFSGTKLRRIHAAAMLGTVFAFKPITLLILLEGNASQLAVKKAIAMDGETPGGILVTIWRKLMVIWLELSIFT